MASGGGDCAASASKVSRARRVSSDAPDSKSAAIDATRAAMSGGSILEPPMVVEQAVDAVADSAPQEFRGVERGVVAVSVVQLVDDLVIRALLRVPRLHEGRPCRVVLHLD